MVEAAAATTLTAANVAATYKQPRDDVSRDGLTKAVAARVDSVAAVIEDTASDIRASTVAAIDLSDPMIPRIVEDKKNWKQYVNDVEAWTFIGNSEIAIKMESLGEYHLKGVTVDNDGAGEAAFDVLGQTVSVLATAYGLPATSGGKADGQPQGQGVSGPSLRAKTLAIEGKNAVRGERMTQFFQNVLTIVDAVPGKLPGTPTMARRTHTKGCGGATQGVHRDRGQRDRQDCGGHLMGYFTGELVKAAKAIHYSSKVFPKGHHGKVTHDQGDGVTQVRVKFDDDGLTDLRVVDQGEIRRR